MNPFSSEPEPSFTEEEARAYVGKTFKALINFAGVPEGTLAKVIGIDHEGLPGWDIMLQWELDYYRPPLVDWFCKAELDFIAEVVAPIPA